MAELCQFVIAEIVGSPIEVIRQAVKAQTFETFPLGVCH